MDERSKQIYNRLKAIADANREMIAANPFPYLDKVNAENARLRAAIDEAYAVLSGVNNFDYASDIAPSAEPSLVITCTKQNAEAEGILWAAMRGGE